MQVRERDDELTELRRELDATKHEMASTDWFVYTNRLTENQDVAPVSDRGGEEQDVALVSDRGGEEDGRGEEEDGSESSKVRTSQTKQPRTIRHPSQIEVLQSELEVTKQELASARQELSSIRETESELATSRAKFVLERERAVTAAQETLHCEFEQDRINLKLKVTGQCGFICAHAAQWVGSAQSLYNRAQWYIPVHMSMDKSFHRRPRLSSI